MYFTYHANERLIEYEPIAKPEPIIEALHEYMETGYHPNIDRVAKIRDDAALFRYHAGEVFVYPVVDTVRQAVITIYPHAYVAEYKGSRRTKKRKKRHAKKGKL